MSIQTETPTPDDLLSESEAGEILNIKPATLRNWRLGKKHLSFVKLPNGSIRYRRSVLDTAIEDGEVEAHPKTQSEAV